MYGAGISREGSVIDLGSDLDIVKKSGAWYTYEGEQLGQGWENAKRFLTEKPEVKMEITDRVWREAMPDTASYSYEALAAAEGPVLFLVGVTDDDSSSVQIDGIWYNERPAGLGISDEAPIATRFELGQNYPNPFNPSTSIDFSIAEPSIVDLSFYDASGRLVRTLVSDNKA